MKQTLKDSKYTHAALYFTTHCNNRFLGKTKLNKLFYYLDFISYRDRQHSVTGDIYISLEYGPVPSEIDRFLTDLVQQKKLSVELVPTNKGSKMRFTPREEPNLKAFDSFEKDLLKQICKKFQLWNTNKIVTQTHLEAPWFYAKPYGIVDFGYAHDIDVI